jgi:hypothetical protein
LAIVGLLWSRSVVGFVIFVLAVGIVQGVPDGHSMFRQQFGHKGKLRAGRTSARVVCKTTAGQLIINVKREWSPLGADQ